MSGTEQIAQQASNPAAQQLQAAQPTTTSSGPSGSIDSLQCQWGTCSDRAATAEQLYEHVCERHVGRKSTNNLNLTCQWGNCHTTTVKRDHITSHIRVHVPLKPHKCDFCGKSFKRPQDLKKHVKTHADESVIMRSPEPASGSRHHPNGGYNMNTQPRPQGYYPEQQLQPNMPMNYAFQGHNPNGNTHQGYYAPTAQTTSQSYGPVYYNSIDPGNQASYNDRKRGVELVDGLFGSIKRQEFDPHSYPDISNRLTPFHNVQLPVLSSSGGMSGYDSGPTMMTAQAPSALYTGPAAHGYSLPIPNLRTKQDMVDAENYLQNMVQTAYESSNSLAASGVSQPGAHHIPSGLTLRASNSPPGMQLQSAHRMSSHSHDSHASTPELTPGSSHYTEHSPTSGVSPTEQQPMLSQASAYPVLPTVSASMAGQAPHSTLGNHYDHDTRRRYSGGSLQKAAPGAGMTCESLDHMDIDNTNPSTPKAAMSTEQHRTRGMVSKHMIDPALSGDIRSRSSSLTLSATATPIANGGDVEETWVENMRLLEYLRNFVRQKLERGEYEDDVQHRGEKSLYPELKV